MAVSDDVFMELMSVALE